MTADWLQINLLAVEHSPEQLEAALLDAGAMAITLQDAADDPVLEPAPGTTPLWQQTKVQGLFDTDTCLNTVRQQLITALGPNIIAYLQEQTLADRDWERVCLEHFKPLLFGQRLWVCPSHRPPPRADAVNIILDPGLAFGTGTHPTTALCLTWLDSADIAGKTLLDFGCGSGILALAAAKLGAHHIWCVDIDPQALWATRRNAERNQVENQLSVLLPEHLADIQADIVIANILAGPLSELAPRFAELTHPDSTIVLSGLLNKQRFDIEKTYRPWFAFSSARQRENWLLLQAQRRT